MNKGINEWLSEWNRTFNNFDLNKGQPKGIARKCDLFSGALWTKYHFDTNN